MVLFYFSGTIVNAQETIQELSKKAKKGFLTETDNSDGNYLVTYKTAGDRKKNEVFYETYLFDNTLKFIKNEDVSEPKITVIPDKQVTRFAAYVGGCSSFDVLSMKLKLTTATVNTKWD